MCKRHCLRILVKDDGMRNGAKRSDKGGCVGHWGLTLVGVTGQIFPPTCGSFTR